MPSYQNQNPKLKQRYKEAYENSELIMERHPLTPLFADHSEWVSWAEWMVSNFQRSSSAVEGRNGCLSQLCHNGRGLSGNRLKALTAIHNFGLRRSDSTTAAERLFRRDFPDIFEWVIERMGELPEPRNSANSPMRLTSRIYKVSRLMLVAVYALIFWDFADREFCLNASTG